MTTKPFILTAQEGLKLKYGLMKVLQRGQNSAIRGKDLAHTFGYPDDRRIRLAIRELISEGTPIASSVSEPMGFYIVANEFEAGRYIKGLKDRIKEDENRLRDFENACSDMSIPEQPSLFGE